MESDFKNSIYRIEPDKVVKEKHKTNTCAGSLVRHEYGQNIRAALDHPIAKFGVRLACMDSNDKALNFGAHLLLFNRAHDLDKHLRFAKRWSRQVGGHFSHRNVA